MASSLIYLIIIGMWVAYFLPRWMSSHDEVSGRSAERYKSAMKLVSEQEPTIIQTAHVEPVKKKNSLAMRRAIFSTLGLSFLASLVVVALGILAWSVLFIPVSGFLIYSVHVRRQIIAAQAKARRLKALEQISAAPLASVPEAKISLARESRTENELWTPLADRLDSAGVVVIPRESQGWQPVQVPKPTYASAPKAVASKRVIDLTVPGAWMEEQEILHKVLLPTREELFDQELAEQAAIMFDDVEDTRAVND